jgi:hypothetical protein
LARATQRRRPDCFSFSRSSSRSLSCFARQAGGVVAGNEKLLAELVWPHFWAVQIVLFVLIAIYCTMHELARVIGKEEMLRMFFGPMPLPQV